MDDAVNRFAHEVAEVVAAAAVNDPRLEAARTKILEEGYEVQITLEAVVAFYKKGQGGEKAQIKTPPKQLTTGRRPFELTGNDKRFLRALRIGADEKPA